MNASRNVSLADLERIDAHIIADHEYEDVPELADEDFARGTWSCTPGPLIDDDILTRFRATGPGWEDRINSILRAAADALDAA